MTTDDGTMHVFDIRSHLRSAAIVYDSKKAVSYALPVDECWVRMGTEVAWSHVCMCPWQWGATQPLYGHSYINSNTAVLGFGDGSVQLHDMRMRRW